MAGLVNQVTKEFNSLPCSEINLSTALQSKTPCSLVIDLVGLALQLHWTIQFFGWWIFVVDSLTWIWWQKTSWMIMIKYAKKECSKIISLINISWYALQFAELLSSHGMCNNNLWVCRRYWKILCNICTREIQD